MDSTGRIVSAMQTTARNLELPIPSEKDVRGIIGLSLSKCYSILFPDVEDHDWLTEEYRFQYVEGDKTPSPLFSGVKETLHYLKEHNYHLAVATGKARPGLDRVLDESELRGYFDWTIGADEAISKPHPKMLHTLLSKANLSSEQAVMVGDTSFDLEMAQNANMPSIGVSFGAHSAESLSSFSPQHIIDDFTELQNIFQK